MFEDHITYYLRVINKETRLTPATRTKAVVQNHHRTLPAQERIVVICSAIIFYKGIKHMIRIS